jgi:hypothetical protein
VEFWEHTPKLCAAGPARPPPFYDNFIGKPCSKTALESFGVLGGDIFQGKQKPGFRFAYGCQPVQAEGILPLIT